MLDRIIISLKGRRSGKDGFVKIKGLFIVERRETWSGETGQWPKW